jgi:hypothetical protein
MATWKRVITEADISSSELTAIGNLSGTNTGDQTLPTASSLGLVIGSNVQAYDQQLDTWATVTPSNNGKSLVAAADYAAMKTLLSIGTLGSLNTINNGQWSGTDLSVANGGTNISSYTTGDLLYASASGTLSKLGVGTNGQVLTTNGSVPSWGSPASGDITGVTAGTGLSGGGDAGAVTVNVEAAQTGISSIYKATLALGVAQADAHINFAGGLSGASIEFGTEATETLGFYPHPTESTIDVLEPITSRKVHLGSASKIYGEIHGREIYAAYQLYLGGTAVTSTAAELNLLDGVSGLVQADFTKLAAVDATAAELNYVDGVTSNIQTQLDAKGAGDITSVIGGTNCSVTGGTTGDATVNVDDAFLVNNASDSTSGTITAAGFTTSGTVSCATLQVSSGIVDTTTETLAVKDSKIVLNSDYSGSSPLDAGFIVERSSGGATTQTSSANDSCMYFDESAGRWTIFQSTNKAMPTAAPTQVAAGGGYIVTCTTSTSAAAANNGMGIGSMHVKTNTNQVYIRTS